MISKWARVGCYVLAFVLYICAIPAMYSKEYAHAAALFSQGAVLLLLSREG